MTGKTEFLQERKNRDGSPAFLSSLKGLEGFVTPFYPALKRWAIVTKKQARRNRRSKFWWNFSVSSLPSPKYLSA